MTAFQVPDWSKLFIPSQSILETVIRGTVLYVGIVLLMRFVLQREKGQLGVTDLLVIVLLGDAAQNAMAGSYSSITDGMILILTLVFWSSAINLLAFRFPWLESVLSRRRLPIVRNGKMLHRNMRRELITEHELMSQIRLQGVADLQAVHVAYVEPDGRISVITRKDEPDSRGAPERDSA